MLLPGGGRGEVALLVQRMVTTLQRYLRAARLSSKFTMHSVRSSGSMRKTLAGTLIDTTMHMSGWKTESKAPYYIGAITCTMVARAKRRREEVCANVSDVPLSPAFVEDFAECPRRFHCK